VKCFTSFRYLAIPFFCNKAKINKYMYSATRFLNKQLEMNFIPLVLTWVKLPIGRPPFLGMLWISDTIAWDSGNDETYNENERKDYKSYLSSYSHSPNLSGFLRFLVTIVIQCSARKEFVNWMHEATAEDDWVPVPIIDKPFFVNEFSLFLL
jgi:hypothetical protein